MIRREFESVGDNGSVGRGEDREGMCDRGGEKVDDLREGCGVCVVCVHVYVQKGY